MSDVNLFTVDVQKDADDPDGYNTSYVRVGPLHGAHKVTNRTDSTLRVAILSNKGDPGASVYSDSDKVGIWPPGKLFRLGDAVDYWDGEI